MVKWFRVLKHSLNFLTKSVINAVDSFGFLFSNSPPKQQIKQFKRWIQTRVYCALNAAQGPPYNGETEWPRSFSRTRGKTKPTGYALWRDWITASFLFDFFLFWFAEETRPALIREKGFIGALWRIENVYGAPKRSGDAKFFLATMLPTGRTPLSLCRQWRSLL